VEDEVVPSARGWDAPETMSAGSLAERFIQERRQSQDRADLTEDGELFEARDEGGGSREL